MIDRRPFPTREPQRIRDDTGALDSALAFADEGRSVQALVRPRRAPRAGLDRHRRDVRAHMLRDRVWGDGRAVRRYDLTGVRPPRHAAN